MTSIGDDELLRRQIRIYLYLVCTRIAMKEFLKEHPTLGERQDGGSVIRQAEQGAS
jgi:hypothetical protein